MPLPKLPGSDEAHWAKYSARKLAEKQEQHNIILNNDYSSYASSSSSSITLITGEIRFQRGKLIGSGSFGKVYQCFDLSNGELIAVKQIDLLNKESKLIAEQATTEISLMKQLNHKNIVKLISSHISTDNSTCIDTMNIIMEYIPGRSISDLLTEFGPFPEEICKKYMNQLELDKSCRLFR